MQALSIYKKYLQFKSEGKFEEVLEDIYNEGRKYNWKPTPGVFPTSCIGSPLNSYSTLPETNTTDIPPPSTSDTVENQTSETSE